MKKIAVTIAIVLAFFTTIVKAENLKNSNWYAGSKIAWSRFHDTKWHGNIVNDGPTQKNQPGLGIFSGYEINPYISFEIGYDWFGRMPYKGKIRNGSLKSQGIQITTKLNYPVANNLDIYTRLGGMLWRTNFNSNISNARSDTGVSPLFSGGVEWMVTRNISTRLEYQWVNNIGNNSTIFVRPDNNILSLGMVYSFSHQENHSAIIPLKEMKTKNFTLKSEVLFNFDKATLKPEGQKIIDQLYNQLSNMNLKSSSVVVIGFTDRIGSNIYNQNLSKRRAKTIVDYLLSKGIPNNKIIWSGMGELNSITGNTCDDIKKRDKLINCLAPDRRVNIEVKGIKYIIVQSSV